MSDADYGFVTILFLMIMIVLFRVGMDVQDIKRSIIRPEESKKELSRVSNLGDSETMRRIIIEALVEDFGHTLRTARMALNKSYVSKMIDKDPDFVGHYGASHWARIIQEEMVK